MSRRSSDLDFGDVFGGPPRRSGVYDRQSGRADSFDSSAYPRGRSRGGEERSPFQKSTSSSGLMEKHVFGELSSPAHRRHLAEDFFDDIFHGSDQSGNSTPRRTEQDVFSPTPASRVLSPNRPVPVGGSSLLPRHSLPVKTMKGVEYPFHSARIQPSTFKIEESGGLDTPEFVYMPNSSPFAEEILEEPPRSAGKLFNNVNPLSRQLSRDIDDASSMESQSQKDRISLENYINSKQFHFSIYKWAGKGVSLNLPSNSKEGTDAVSRISRLAEVVIQSVDMPYDDDKVPAATSVPNNQNENKDKTLPNGIPMESKNATISTMAEDTLHPETSLKVSSRDLTENSVLSGEGMMKNSNEDVPAFLHDPIKPESRNLSQLCSDHSEEKGIEERTRQTVPESSKEGLKDESNIKYENKAKKITQEENKTVQVEAAVNHGIQYLPAVSKDEVPGKKAKGKVKDFIKIFSQEGSPKRKATSETEDRKSKGKERTKNKVDEQINMSVAEEDEEVKDSYTKIEQPSVTATVELNKASKEDVIHHSPVISDVHTTDDDPSTGRDFNLEPGTESVKESINISVEEFPYEDFEGCLVNEVVQNQDESIHAESEQDQIKAADVKIREWSKGKEGNIRSLLSTLQYVLWPESGWKPVPLVNIIEGSSVKRSYQRALLCLHPDKLQQRGAAMHQKYIAEKVFDILQEAWDQFNSLGVF